MPELSDRLRRSLAGRYVIERELGRGGMATVYLASDLKHHRKVAIKVLDADLAATVGPGRFLREIEIAARLTHPHILPLLDSGQAEDLLYYVMPFIEGESLRARLSAERSLPIGDTVKLLRDVVDALAYAHAQGVVHRDIKPGNVMLSGRHALVADFGVAKALNEATGVDELTSLALTVVSVVSMKRSAAVRHARQDTLPAIQRFVDDAEWGKAYELAKSARTVIPDDAVLASLTAASSGPLNVVTEPSGTKVYRKDYSTPDADWELLGETPLDGVRIPLPFSFSRLMLVKPGFVTLFDVTGPDAQRYKLDAMGALPQEMVRVTGGRLGLTLVGLDHLEPINLEDYLMDRFETTNRQFKQFVDAGGYQKKEYWGVPFVKDGRQLAWEEVVPEFKDRTGRLGPATWEVGDYPAGHDDYPVTGVSWYEAAAFAEFAGKQLPTVYHWATAARLRLSSAIVPHSNMESRSSGPAPVGKYNGMNGFGVSDMAGNAREWVFNEAGDKRYLLGGSWDDTPDMFTGDYAAFPLDRSPQNGFRLVTYLSDDNLAVAQRPIAQPYRDFRKIQPVSNATFAIYRRMYDYDRTPLRATVEDIDSSSKDWIKQRITFDAAYGHERMMAYLFLPQSGRPPYQTVVHFPGDGWIAVRSSSVLQTLWFDFIVKSGRALMYPIYKSTYERGDGLTSTYPTETNYYKEHVIHWAQDLKRSIDYLETRDEVDTTRLAYYGLSWGGRLGGIMLAIEPRFRAAVLNVAGLRFQKGFPEVEPVNFLPRIKVPVLMLNGRYDYYFPVESSQKPMFEGLGTPTDDKRHVIAEGSHFVPRPLLIKETLDWLDRYLGPVK